MKLGEVWDFFLIFTWNSLIAELIWKVFTIFAQKVLINSSTFAFISYSPTVTWTFILFSHFHLTNNLLSALFRLIKSDIHKTQKSFLHSDASFIIILTENSHLLLKVFFIHFPTTFFTHNFSTLSFFCCCSFCSHSSHSNNDIYVAGERKKFFKQPEQFHFIEWFFSAFNSRSFEFHFFLFFHSSSLSHSDASFSHSHYSVSVSVTLSTSLRWKRIDKSCRSFGTYAAAIVKR